MLRWIAWPPAMTSSALVLLAEELSGAFGKHRRWRNAVDANVVATELAREAARQSDHRRLRYRVVQRKRHAVDRGKGGHVDDTAAPCLAHLRHHCLAALPYALDVRAHRIVPFGLADRLETATTKRTVERGVVDQDVDATELCRRIGPSLARKPHRRPRRGRLSRFHPPGRRPSAAMTRAPACASTRTH